MSTAISPSITVAGAQRDFSSAIANGEQVRLRFFSFSGANTGYDDQGVFTRSGIDLWVSGLTMPINTSKGGHEALLVEQGKLLSDDKIVYLKGDVNVSGTWQMGLGSPVVREYANVSPGQITWSLEGCSVYHKVYVRHLTTGSLYDGS